MIPARIDFLEGYSLFLIPFIPMKKSPIIPAKPRLKALNRGIDNFPSALFCTKFRTKSSIPQPINNPTSIPTDFFCDELLLE